MPRIASSDSNVSMTVSASAALAAVRQSCSKAVGTSAPSSLRTDPKFSQTRLYRPLGGEFKRARLCSGGPELGLLAVPPRGGSIRKNWRPVASVWGLLEYFTPSGTLERH